ncbi:MAG: hypothetical protein ACSLFP_01670 [Acidimicrobiales bacterium]
MRTRPVALVLGLALAVAACASEEVAIAFRPEPGAQYRFRYEISGTVTTTTDDGSPTEVTELATTLETDQEVLEVIAEGALVELRLRQEGGAERSAVVALDRAGSLRSIETIEDLPVDAFVLPAAGSVEASDAAAPPRGPLTIGQRWSIDQGALTGEARLDSLGVVDGHDVARVDAELDETVDDAVTAGGSAVRLDGSLRTRTSTTFDLDDGAVRRGRTTTTGTVRARIEAPPDIVAPPVTASIRYRLVVVTTRL